MWDPRITGYSRLEGTPKGSSSPVLQWMIHTGIKPMTLVLPALCSDQLSQYVILSVLFVVVYYSLIFSIILKGFCMLLHQLEKWLFRFIPFWEHFCQDSQGAFVLFLLRFTDFIIAWNLIGLWRKKLHRCPLLEWALVWILKAFSRKCHPLPQILYKLNALSSSRAGTDLEERVSYVKLFFKGKKIT